MRVKFNSEELSLACWAFSSSTGQTVPSEEVVARAHAILDAAVVDGVTSAEERDDILTRLLYGVAPAEQSPPATIPAWVLVEQWLSRGGSPREVLVLWRSAPERESQGDAHQLNVEAFVDAVSAESRGIPMYAVEPEPRQATLVEVLCQLVGASGYEVRCHDLAHTSLAAIEEIVPQGAPVDVLFIPPHGAMRDIGLDPAVAKQVENQLGLELDGSECASAIQQVVPALLAKFLAEGSRICWFGFQPVGFHLLHREDIGRASREVLIENCEWIELAHFEFGSTPLLAEYFTLWGGHSMHCVRVGRSQCQLRVTTVRSWIDWFTRVRPTWFAHPSSLPSETPEDLLPRGVMRSDASLPWTYEFMGPNGYDFRRKFLPYGDWTTLGAFGVFSNEFVHDEESLAPYVAAASDPDRVWVPVISSLKEARSWPVEKPDGIWLKASARDDWDFGFLRPGLLFDAHWHAKHQDLKDFFTPLESRHQEAMTPYDKVRLTPFGFFPSTGEPLRRWVTDFLSSPAGDGWARIQGYAEEDTSIFAWDAFLIPLPSEELLSAYAQTDHAISQLREVADRLQQDRLRIFEGGVEAPRWERLRNLGVRAQAVGLLLSDSSPEELPIRLTFPYPLSIGFRTFRAAKESGDRLRIGLVLAENTAAYLLALGLALEFSRGTLPPAVLLGYKTTLTARGGLTFGSQLSLLNKLVGGDGATSVLERLWSCEAYQNCLSALEFAKQVRNRDSHLLGPGGDGVDTVVCELEVRLRTAYHALEPIAGIQLLVVESAANDPVTGECSGYRARVIAGDHPDGWLVESDKPLPRSVFPGALYLRTPEGDLHVANPFFRIREVRSGVPTVAVLTKIEDEGPRYRSLTERESWTEPSAIGQVSRTLG